jgi:hypothetical protein
MAFLDFLIARFSLMDLPDFLLADCRGDLSDMTAPYNIHYSIGRSDENGIGTICRTCPAGWGGSSTW